MTKQQFDEAVATFDGKTLVDFCAAVQAQNEFIRYMALVFGERGRVREVVSIPRNADLRAVAQRMSAACKRSNDAYDPTLPEDHRQITILCNMDHSRDVFIPYVGLPMDWLPFGVPNEEEGAA